LFVFSFSAFSPSLFYLHFLFFIRPFLHFLLPYIPLLSLCSLSFSFNLLYFFTLTCLLLYLHLFPLFSFSVVLKGWAQRIIKHIIQWTFIFFWQTLSASLEPFSHWLTDYCCITFSPPKIVNISIICPCVFFLLSKDIWLYFSYLLSFSLLMSLVLSFPPSFFCVFLTILFSLIESVCPLPCDPVLKE
jgi:hypothetical protein